MMEVVTTCCAGIDVHKENVVVCVRRERVGMKCEKEIRKFGTMTRELVGLVDWLREWGCEKVAMESTGVYWIPVYNVLEGEAFEVLLVNARHLKQVPGRKTDVRDCEWIADLLQHGLLRGSFVPEQAIRDLRGLTRYRVTLVEERTRLANRIQKTLEQANVKLGNVASDVLGVSGRAMLEAIVAGEADVRKLADLAKGRLRQKRDILELALEGRVTQHHRALLKKMMDHLRFLERQIHELEAEIEEAVRPFEVELEALQTIPGVQRTAGIAILAEIGTDMNRFPSHGHLASWAGMCPGNDESAGKQRSGKTRKGNVWLRRALNQAAWAASHTGQTYLSAQYHRLVTRRGKKRANVAVGHSILVVAYHILKTGQPYQDLGHDYFDRTRVTDLTRYYRKRLEKLGFDVTLQVRSAAA